MHRGVRTLLPLRWRRHLARWRTLNRQRVLSAAGRKGLKLRYGTKPVPLPILERLAGIAGGDDPVLPKYERAQSSSRIHDPDLRSILVGRDLGGWSLTASALNLLQDEIVSRRPALTIELGSGVSTVCLALHLSKVHGPEELRLVSLEQEEGFAEETRRSLEKVGLSNVAKVLWSPLVLRDGREFYDLEREDVRDVLEGLKADLLLVDGPAGGPAIRRMALPRLLPFLSSGARFMLDDALRQSEMEIAREWSAIRQADIEGIILVGQGMLVGTVTF